MYGTILRIIELDTEKEIACYAVEGDPFVYFVNNCTKYDMNNIQVEFGELSNCKYQVMGTYSPEVIKCFVKKYPT